MEKCLDFLSIWHSSIDCFEQYVSSMLSFEKKKKSSCEVIQAKQKQ